MKNLSNFKIIIKTREYLIQAIYQMLFSNDDVQKIITQLVPLTVFIQVKIWVLGEMVGQLRQIIKSFTKKLCY